MSIKNVSSSNPVPQDLSKKLGANGIGIILTTLWLGYYDLKRDGIITASSDEDAITIEWYFKIYNRWNAENRASQVNMYLIPTNQYPDDTLKKKRGKTPAIDFCFRAWKKDDGYFGAECKRLRSDQVSLIREYVDEGVKRFTTGKYGSKSTVSAMVGYIQEGTIPDIVNLIKPFLLTANLEQNLVREMLEKNPQYKSIHTRDLDSLSITLHHLFFDFAA